ncbi:sulfurtransferase TusA family protein [Oscillibacter sp. CU971]|uniref:sulfurtransferase TusA family protein n=1 Tax=Oscillibacter sp. CU971 TaxID=2780102 RepID=UPI00195682F2|nr:sulfurtransferase TusA family protein [Oscillibacter sp. CU971]
MIDARGQSCPIPVVMTRKVLEKEKPARLEVLVDAQVAVENITRCAGALGYQVAAEAQGPDFKLTLMKGD